MIRPNQIVIWVSLTSVGQLIITPDTPRFPVLVDTGLNHNFSIKEEHVAVWAGVSPASLPKLGKSIVNGVEIPQHNANVWLHRNQLGEADVSVDGGPIFLELDGGISISPRGLDFPAGSLSRNGAPLVSIAFS